MSRTERQVLTKIKRKNKIVRLVGGIMQEPIKVGNLVSVSNQVPNLAIVTEIVRPSYGIPPVYWVKFVDNGEELRVQNRDIKRVIK